MLRGLIVLLNVVSCIFKLRQMNHPQGSYRIFPLGDSSVTVDFGNVIDEWANKKALALFQQLSNEPFPGLIEAVPAYSSLTVYYDLFAISKTMNGNRSVLDYISHQLAERIQEPHAESEKEPIIIDVPVCYDREFAPDIEWLAAEKNISVDEVARVHCSKPYRVYMLGFLPGFSYMGELDEMIAAPRKKQPMMVAAGSIGIAGRQTGIYPSASPGGWQIIGRTPLKLFDPGKTEMTLLKAGDIVQFISISKNEFENY